MTVLESFIKQESPPGPTAGVDARRYMANLFGTG
jgi:hypothetical protein